MIKSLQKQGVLDLKTELSLLSAQSIDELDLAYAPFKGVYENCLPRSLFAYLIFLYR